MKQSRYQLKVVAGSATDVLTPATVVKALDNSKAPWTGQPDGTAPVYLFRDMITLMQCYVDRYGDQVGYTHHHCGMGRYSDEIVVLESIGQIELELES